MIQKETNLVVADNSGARKVRAFTSTEEVKENILYR